jgi:hypothetical protein
MVTYGIAELNSIKEKMSVAYLYGLNAKVNYALMESNKDFDGIQVDFKMANKKIGPGRSVASESHEINLQLKAVSISSSSMIEEKENEFIYSLKNDLQPLGTHFIILLVLPPDKEIETWHEVTPEYLLLRSAAYFYLVSKPLKPGKIQFDKSNVLNPTSLVKLFDAAKLKDAL